MRRTAPGYVQLPQQPVHHPQHQSQRAGTARSPAAGAGPGGSPLARTSTTASYFEDESDTSKTTSSTGNGKGPSPDSRTAGAAALTSRPPNSRTKSNSSVHSVSSLRSATGSNYTASSSSPSAASATATATAGSHHQHLASSSSSKPHYYNPHSHSQHHSVHGGTGHQQHSYRYYPGQSPAASSNSSKTTQAEEIEASLRQWRNQCVTRGQAAEKDPANFASPIVHFTHLCPSPNSVFPSLKAGNYVSPGQETPDRDPIHPVVEPMLPSIFQAGSPNAKCRVQSYSSARDFLAALTAEEEYEHSWRLEMVLGQTEDLQYSPAGSDGIWLAVWSGEDSDGTRLLE